MTIYQIVGPVLLTVLVFGAVLFHRVPEKETTKRQTGDERPDR